MKRYASMKKALLVIDMQNICVGQKHSDFFKYDSEKLIMSVNEMIGRFENNEVIYIRNIMKRNIINKFAPFQAYDGTEEAELAEGLDVVSKNVFDKYSGNAFSNAELDDFLKSQETECVEIIGVDGGGCVALTALGALKKGYKVIVNTKAIGTMFEKKKNSYFKKLKKQGAVFV